MPYILVIRRESMRPLSTQHGLGERRAGCSGPAAASACSQARLTMNYGISFPFPMYLQKKMYATRIWESKGAVDVILRCDDEIVDGMSGHAVAYSQHNQNYR
jgi:hypothetical protein